MSDFSSLEHKYPLPAWRLFGWLIVVMIIGFGFWITYAELEEVAVIPGEVVPADKVKAIQHLEGGIIEKIFVRDGDIVKQNDPLIQLDLAVNAMNEDALKVQLDGLLIKRARLSAEAAGTKPVFPKADNLKSAAILNAEKNAYTSRQAQIESKLRVLGEKALQKSLDVKQLKLKLAAARSDLEVATRKFEMSRDLLAANLTPKIEHLQLEKERTKLIGEASVLGPGIPRAQAAAAEARERIVEEKLHLRQEANEELGDVEIEIARLKEILTTAKNQDLRTTLRSPIDGIVKNIRITTIGGVIRPGDIVMNIVPNSDKLVVEAQLKPADRGFIHIGQSAVVKITAYDFFTYGGINGKISKIAADSTHDQSGNTYFKIVIETTKADAGSAFENLPVTPGMQAMVDIHTGSKPVLDYLLKPVLRLKHESFRER